MAGYKPGDIVLKEKPFVHVLDPESKGKLCDHCFNESSAFHPVTLKRCAGCSNNFYCNRQCQTQDWLFHKHECKIYKIWYQYLGDSFNSFKRLVIRLHQLLTKHPEKRREMFAHSGNGQLRSYEDLISHKEKFPRGNFDYIATMFSRFGIQFQRDDLIEMCCKAQINSDFFSSVGAGAPRTIGEGVYIHSRNYEQSCRPNTAIELKDGLFILRAMANIKPGETITVNYTHGLQNTRDRKASLYNSVFRTCECSRCTSGEDDDIDYDELKKQMERFGDHLKRLEFRKALDMSPQIERDLRRVYGEYYPDVSNHMFFEFMALLALKEYEIAYKKIEKVRESLRITHGEDNPAYKQAMQFQLVAVEIP